MFLMFILVLSQVINNYKNIIIRNDGELNDIAVVVISKMFVAHADLFWERHRVTEITYPGDIGSEYTARTKDGYYTTTKTPLMQKMCV